MDEESRIVVVELVGKTAAATKTVGFVMDAVREVIRGGDRVVVIARITGQHGDSPEGRLDLEEVYLYTWKDGRMTDLGPQ